MTVPCGRVIWMFLLMLLLFCDPTTHKSHSLRKNLTRIRRDYRNLRREVRSLNEKLSKLKDNREAVACPAGFVAFYRRCLWFVFEPRLNWENARLHCLKHSSRLLIDNSTRKHDFIVKFLQNNSPPGSSDLYTAGNYGCLKGHYPIKWDPGTKYRCKIQVWHWDSYGELVTSSNENWVDGHPPDLISMESALSMTGVACLRISRERTTYGKWLADSCETKLPFICELKLPKVKKEKSSRHKREEL